MTVVPRTVATASSSAIVKGDKPVSLRVRVVSGMPVREDTSRRERMLASMSAATSLATASVGLCSIWRTLRPAWSECNRARGAKMFRRMYQSALWRYFEGMADNMRERSDMSRALAEQVRAERAVTTKSQRMIAEEADIPYGTYRRLEDGSRVIDVTQLDKLARVFGLSMTELVGRATARLNYVDASTRQHG